MYLNSRGASLDWFWIRLAIKAVAHTPGGGLEGLDVCVLLAPHLDCNFPQSKSCILTECKFFSHLTDDEVVSQSMKSVF